MGDFINHVIEGAVIVTIVGVIAFGGWKPFKNWVVDNYNSLFKYDSAYSQMINLADMKELHPTYGNNNGFFDHEEFLGVAKDLGVTFAQGQKIPYKHLEQYVQKYQPPIKE